MILKIYIRVILTGVTFREVSEKSGGNHSLFDTLWRVTNLFYFKFFFAALFKNNLLFRIFEAVQNMRIKKKFRYSFDVFWRDLLC